MSPVKPVPIREDRLDSFVGHGGSCRELCGEIRCKCLKKMNRTFSQATVCAEWYSMFTLLSVQNSAVVLHGPHRLREQRSEYEYLFPFRPDRPR